LNLWIIVVFVVEQLQKRSLMSKFIRVIYTNWRQETKVRNILPIAIYWGSTNYYPIPQWIVKAYDKDRQDYRLYSLKNIVEIVDENEK